eukprot:361197-Chlamydomonas_euryale.AAC.5
MGAVREAPREGAWRGSRPGRLERRGQRASSGRRRRRPERAALSGAGPKRSQRPCSTCFVRCAARASCGAARAGCVTAARVSSTSDV